MNSGELTVKPGDEVNVLFEKGERTKTVPLFFQKTRPIRLRSGMRSSR